MELKKIISNFSSRIKEISDMFGAIAEIFSNNDLIAITLNQMFDDYHIFITRISSNEKHHTFDELTYIILQEEETRKNINGRSQSSNLLLVTKEKKPYRGNLLEKNKGGKSRPKSYQAITPTNKNTYMKRRDVCLHCGNIRNFAKY